MTIPKFDQLTGNESLPQLIEMVAKLQKQVQWLMDGKIGSDNIRANSIVAEKMDVNELSAITADMGKLTSGEIYGAYIATAEGVYPRAEMSSTDDLFGAYASATKYLRMASLDGSTSAPTLIVRDGAIPLTALIFADNVLNELSISSTKTIQISALPGGDVKINGNLVRFQSWSNIFSDGASQTLQSALNNKANGSGLSRTVYVATSAGGSPTSPMTISNGIVTS